MVWPMTQHQVSLSDHVVAPPRSDWQHSVEVLADVAYRRITLVNVVFVGLPQEPGWVLIDAGVGRCRDAVRHAAEERFGPTPPAAIVLTHGHFDHVGAVRALAKEWNVPVFAHPLERRYLDGTRSYPPPNSRAGGGLMARLSPLYPRGPINLGTRLKLLPANGEIPPLPGWRWLHTPGHTDGHISLWRASDRTLISGDAVITTRQESAYAVLVQEPEMHGPPRYFTPDWDAARESVRLLAALEPETLVSGHGRPLRGEEMRSALHVLARDFDHIARPQSS